MKTLLLHGFSRDGRMWAPLADGLAPDLPGHRRTPPPTGTFEDVVDALAGFAEAPFGVIGYSMGARLALSLAVRHPHRVAWLVLDGASLGLETEAERIARRAHDAKWAALLRTEGISAFARQWAAQPLFGAAPATPDRLEHDPHALAQALERLGKAAMPWLGHHARAVRCPVLLINGDRDVKGLAEAARVAEAIPHALRRTLPGHHAVHLEAPAAWRACTRSFLEDHPLEATA